jgi:phage-related tail fiber protein
MKKSLLFSLLAVSVLTFSCKTDEVVVNPDKIYQVSTTLSGANEVPAVVSSATGVVTGTYNQTKKTLNVTVSYAGIEPTAWHIHKGASGTAGGVVFNFGADFKTPFSSIPLPLTDAQETDLLTGLYYVNIHSTKAPGGEMRGNLSVR